LFARFGRVLSQWSSRRRPARDPHGG
jgi:hypothetical protein